MRLWSLHPAYLDSKGLVALWHEGLLALKVIQGRTRGYRYHHQLIRFQRQKEPEPAMQAYLWIVYEETIARGYHFDVSKLTRKPYRRKILVTAGQLQYEQEHMMQKLKWRDVERYKNMLSVKTLSAHPLFRVVPGEVENWERIGD